MRCRWQYLGTKHDFTAHECGTGCTSEKVFRTRVRRAAKRIWRAHALLLAMRSVSLRGFFSLLAAALASVLLGDAGRCHFRVGECGAMGVPLAH